MKKFFVILSIAALTLVLGGLTASAAATCEQDFNAGANDSTGICDAFYKVTYKFKVKNDADVFINRSHTALSNANIFIGDDWENSAVTLGASLNDVMETDTINTQDSIIEAPGLGSMSAQKLTVDDDDVVASATVVEEVLIEQKAKNELDYVETTTTLADNTFTGVIVDDVEGVVITTKDGNKNLYRHLFDGNVSRIVVASSVSIGP